MNENESSEVALEILTPSALESLERASIDVQVATAHRFPRSLEQFKKRALGMVQQDLDTAESCIYSRPVGKGDDGKQKFAEGASIRMAEIVAACYGNIRFGARIIEQTERYVKAEGVAHDLESNTAGKSEAMESTVKRNGQPYDERMRIVVAKACLSKALRDAIFRVVPRALCKSISDAAIQVINKQAKTLEQRRKSAEQWLSSIKVESARAFAVLNVNGWSEVMEDHLITLTGLKTAVNEKEITLLEAFPLITTAQTSDLAPKVPTAPVVAATAPKPDDKLAATVVAAATPAELASVTCKYCKQPVANMGTHECAEMKEALTKNTAAKPAEAPAATPSQDDSKDAIASIALLADQAGVSEAAVIKFCRANKLMKDIQKTLGELSTAKLLSIIKTWTEILPEIQKHETELTAK